jgi:ABC-type sugar transport system ATPase subunit
MSDLKITGLHKHYGAFHAVKGIDLEVPSGEFTVLVGPSGCGKSTLLRTIAGLEEASRGTVEIGGRNVTWARPRDRDIAMVFQNYALYPYLNVKENIAFGLRARKFADAEVENQIEAMTLADRIVLLRDGEIEQTGRPLELFERPQTRFVAGFLGSPKMNFIAATLTDTGLALADGTRLALPGRQGLTPGLPVVLGLRPQYIAMAGPRLAAGHVRVPVTVELVQPTGSRVQATMPLGGTSIIAELAAHDVSRPGERAEIDIDMTRAVIIDPRTDKVL